MQSNERVRDRRWRPVRMGSRLALACVVLLAALPLQAARQAKTAAASGEGEFEASRLLDKGSELLGSGESERGVKMLETIIEQYPGSHARYAARLTLGRYYVNAHDQIKAIAWLSGLKGLENPSGEVPAADRDLYLEGLYLTGVAYFQMRDYAAAFPVLRKITANYANTAWANQAYYYIGMCHFAQQNWSKAIEALNLVGTFVDADAPETSLVEAGRRLYVKVTDQDLPVLARLGQQTWVDLETTHGDRERVECLPLGGDGSALVGSIPTEVGAAQSGDHVLQVRGGDTVFVRFIDASTQDGATNVVREKQVKVVSSGRLAITLGDFETPAPAAFLDQPLGLALDDADLDTSDAADTTTIKVAARYRAVADDEAPDPSAAGVDLHKLLADDAAPKVVTRDEIVVRLTEAGSAPVHSGHFTGRIVLRAAPPSGRAPVAPPPGDATNVLTCAVDDEIVATYIDERHLGGDTPRTVEAIVRVTGEIDNRPRASQDVVADPVVRARKNLVEAAAYLELARIFSSMGLQQGAKQKAADGLERVDTIIRLSSPIPSDLRQQAVKTRWELCLASDDLAGALAACQLFARLFPDSPLADEALMGIARVRLTGKEYGEASRVLREILALPQSQAKAEAQFRLAEIAEMEGAGKPGGRERAMQEYKLCAERYPDSSFAGQALAKLVDFQVDQRNFAQADELLAQVFQDHPDAAFLDAMLLKWVLVAYSAGDYAKARDKAAQLLSEYPGSPYTEKAKQVLPKIEARLAPGNGPGERTP